MYCILDTNVAGCLRVWDFFFALRSCELFCHLHYLLIAVGPQWVLWNWITNWWYWMVFFGYFEWFSICFFLYYAYSCLALCCLSVTCNIVSQMQQAMTEILFLVATHQKHEAQLSLYTKISLMPKMPVITCQVSTSVTDISLYSTTSRTRSVLFSRFLGSYWVEIAVWVTRLVWCHLSHHLQHCIYDHTITLQTAIFVHPCCYSLHIQRVDKVLSSLCMTVHL